MSEGNVGASSSPPSAARRSAGLAAAALALNLFAICCVPSGFYASAPLTRGGGESVTLVGQAPRPPPPPPVASADTVFYVAFASAVLATLASVLLAIVGFGLSWRATGAARWLAVSSIGLSFVQIVLLCFVGAAAWFLSLNIHL